MPGTPSQNALVTLTAFAVLGAILLDAALHLGGDIPALPKLSTQARPPVDTQFDRRIQSLFSLPTNQFEETTQPDHSPFYTTQFLPPKKAPPPKKKATKKYEITFQGIYKTSSDEQKAFIVLANKFHAVREGNPIVDDLVLLSLDRRQIEIGKSDGPTVKIPFRETRTLEISE